MHSVFNPPTLADADSTLANRLLNGTSLSVAITALVGAILIPLTAPASLWPLYFGIVSVIFLTCLLAFWMLRRGSANWASWLLVIVIWIGITITAVTGGGVQSTAYIGYIGIIMLTGLLLGGPASIAFTVLCIGVGLAMAVGSLNGWLPPVAMSTPVQWWGVSALLLSVCAVIQQFASGSLARVIKRAHDSEANYRMLFEEAPEGILIADAHNQFVMANPAACRMLSYTVEEFMGKSLVDLIAPEDLKRLPIGKVEDIRASGGRKRERLVVHKNGERVPIVISSRYMPDGRFQYILQDITELKQTEAARLRAEEALRQSESMYRRAIEAAGAVPYYLDYTTGQYTFVGDKMTDVTGYPIDQITPDLMGNIEEEYQLLGEAAGLTKAEGIRRVHAGQIRVWKNDSRIRTRDGESRWVSDTSVQMTNETGAMVGAIGIVQDITERKQAELALRESESLHRRAIEAAGAVPYYRDHTLGVFTLMGDGIRQMTGYGPGEVTPQFFDTLIIERVMMGEGSTASPAQATRQARAGQLSIWKCDYKIKRKDGSYRWLADSAVEVLVDSGQSRGSVGILQDITERKEALEEVKRLNTELEQRVAYRTEALRASEARFRATNDASPLGIFVDDANGECVYTNAVYQNITGLSPEGSLGMAWVGAVHPADRDSVAAGWDAARRRTPFRYEQVYRIRRRDGHVVWVSVKASAMHDGGTSLGYVGTVEDITARVEAEESLRRRTAQLEAANQELEAFSYSISHDLRAPLRAMDGFSRLLVEQYSETLDTEAQRYLHKVRDNAQQMGRLIDDLLAFSRLGRHALRLQYLTSADLAALVRRIADEACATAPERRFKVFVGDLPPCEADYNLLNQVFVNLLTNAVKFTRPRTVAEVEIGSLSADDGPAYFVRDNGVGFDMQYASKVFGVFQRLHRVEDFEGTGVGLAIVQRIIHRHGGRIWVEAAPNKGAMFCFTIGKAQLSGE